MSESERPPADDGTSPSPDESGDGAAIESRPGALDRDAFVRAMVREIRAPLAATLGYTDLLREFELSDAERGELVDGLRVAADGLLTLVDRVERFIDLDARSRSIAGLDDDGPHSGDAAAIHGGDSTGTDEALRSAPRIDPVDLVENALARLQPAAEDGDVDLRLRSDGSIPAAISVDESALATVVECLVENAIRWAPSSRVQIVVAWFEPKSQGPGRFEVAVRDRGRGLPVIPEQGIFQPFEHRDTSPDRRWRGAGLGLALADRAAACAGGRLSVDPPVAPAADGGAEVHGPAGGTTFRVSLPAYAEAGTTRRRIDDHAIGRPRSARDAAAGQPLEGLSLVLAESEAEQAWLLRQVLERAGASVRSLGTGSELDLGISAACAAADSSADDAAHGAEGTSAPDMFVAGADRNGRDAIDVIAAVRGAGWRRPLVVIVDQASPARRQELIEAGADAILVRPVDPVRLVEGVVRVRARAVDPGPAIGGDGEDGREGAPGD